jgi:cell division protein FtsL
MFRFGTLISVAILSLSIFGLFQVKYRVQNMREALTEINRQIEQEQEAIHILKAEWTYLNQPERLRKLVAKHLQLAPMQLAQVNKVHNNLPVYHIDNLDSIEDNSIAVANNKPNEMQEQELLQQVRELMGEDHNVRVSKVKY